MDSHLVSSTVPATGRYRLTTRNGVLLTSTIWCVKGRTFPGAADTAPGIGIRYVMDVPTSKRR